MKKAAQMAKTEVSLVLTTLMVMIGCNQRPGDAPQSVAEKPAVEIETSDSNWNERNEGIYGFLLAHLDEPTPDRIYFITTTPMSKWGETGDWSTIPADQMKQFPNAAKYRPASEAHLKDGSVLEKGTDASAWMKWISVKRWISDTEVEVEEGVWCCPLGGGASTTIYEKIDGEWTVKQRGSGWVS